MRRLRFEVETALNAVYGVVHIHLVDYQHNRKKLLPPALRDHGLQILNGGCGAGTIFRHVIRIGIRQRTVTIEAEEPIPGRVIVERNLDLPLITTWTLTPAASGDSTRVHLETEWTPPQGPMALVDRVLVPGQIHWLHMHAIDGLSALVDPPPGCRDA